MSLISFKMSKMLMNNKGHSDRVGGVSWHPQATVSQSESVVNLASGAGDANIHMWSLSR